MTTGAVTAALGTLVIVLSAAVAMLYARARQLRSRYKSIIDAEAEGRRLQADARRNAEELKAAAAEELDRLRKETEEHRKQRDALAAENTAVAATHERLQKEVSTLEENLEDISFGIYKPHFDYDTPEDYKTALEEVIAKQREMVRAGKAARFAVEWSVGGSRREGERMQRQYSKLLLRAFNGECEAAIAKVAWNNANKMEERIRKAFDAINGLGGVMQVSIVDSYMNLKLTELRLEHELEEKKRAVIEEQRKVREQMREQERAQRELDAARADAEEEEARFAKALEKARVDAARAKGEEHARLTSRILELEEELKGARQKRERVSALAELTKAGYVYVLSNIGSFGEGVYKIGMTRRLDPIDRVKELSDASVPFGFDVHAMVYSEDAPAIENAFHERFAERNVNPLNLRKEFFRVSIDELQAFATERGLKIAFTRLPEAREYRETMARGRATGGAALTESGTKQS
jgi:uncharacterized protein DUF4041/Meiotically Up-regulated Gene 113 (MUG113) protein